jgi:hypothetical protein
LMRWPGDRRFKREELHNIIGRPTGYALLFPMGLEEGD